MKTLNGLLVATAFSVIASLGIVSCAVQEGPSLGSTPPQSAKPSSPASMPAAKLGLAPQLRPFHDELIEYGDWILVEPLGWVFRPRVNTVAWRPYQEGHWVASYSYGWVWESAEPFGWITDHYGFWFYDEFQGWVWQPHGAWAPSWVAWVQVGEYLGWAPLPPDAAPDAGRPVPGGAVTYLSKQALAAGGTTARAGFVRDLPDPSLSILPIDRVASRGSVYWNAGPDPEDVMGLANAEQLRLGERDGKVRVPEPAREFSLDMPALRISQLESRTTRTWSLAKRELMAERSRRTGGSPGGTGAVAPAPAPASGGISPLPVKADTTKQDSLARAKAKAKPGIPRPPGH